MITIEEIENIYEQIKPKPNMYHYICYAGTSVKLVDEWGVEPVIKCKYKTGRISTCQNCNGELEGYYALSESQKNKEYGMKELLDAIKSTIERSN